MVDYISGINPYLNIAPSLLQQGAGSQQITRENVKREFMSFFLQEVFGQAFTDSQLALGNRVDQDRSPLNANFDQYKDILVERMIDELMDSGEFGFDELFPSYVKNYAKEDIQDGNKQ